MHMHTPTRVHTCIHAHAHTCTSTHIHMYIHAHVHTYTRTYMHVYTHTHVHTHVHKNTCTYMHMYIPAHVHSSSSCDSCGIITYIHTYILVHTFDKTATFVLGYLYFLLDSIVLSNNNFCTQECVHVCVFIYQWGVFFLELLCHQNLSLCILWPCRLIHDYLLCDAATSSQEVQHGGYQALD